MKAIIIAAAMAAAVASPAFGYTDLDCRHGIGVTTCQPRATNPSAKIILLDEEVRHEDVTDEDRSAWQARCKPRKMFNGLAMVWLYAERYCEFGPLPSK